MAQGDETLASLTTIKARVAADQRESEEAQRLAADPAVQLLMRYLFPDDAGEFNTGDPEFDAARYGETKAAVVLKRLAGALPFTSNPVR